MSAIPDLSPDLGETAVPPMTQRRVLGLAVPIIGENLLQTAVGAIDTLLVGRIGAAAVAGVGIGFELSFCFIAILFAVSIGTTVLVAQAFGAKDPARAGMLARQAILWGVILSIPVAIVGYFATPHLVGVFGADEAVTDYATTYVQITLATIVVLLLNYLTGGVFRGVGDGRTPLIAAIIANVVHIALSWMLIGGEFGLPAWGVAGAAAGTAIGRGVGAAFLLVVLLRGRGPISIRGRGDWFPRVSVARDIFRLGGPGAIEQMTTQAGFILLIAVVASLGTATLAAQQIGFTAMSIGFLPGIAFSTTATALVGQSIGARRADHARDAFRITIFWSLVWLTIGGLILAAFPAATLRLFTDDEAVVAAGTLGMQVIALGLPLWALLLVSSGALRGSGDTRGPMIRGIIMVWSSTALSWIGVEFFDRDLGYVWATFFLTGPVAIAFNIRAFRRRMHVKEAEFRLPADA